MKGIIFYSSNTGNIEQLAQELYNRIQSTGSWSLCNMKRGAIDITNYDAVLIGGWVEGGSLNKEALNFMDQLNLSNKKVGLFANMGVRTNTEHGQACQQNIHAIASKYQSLGVQILQRHIAPTLMDKLANLPDTVIPLSVKTAMYDGINSYQTPTDETYQAIADYFINQTNNA